MIFGTGETSGGRIAADANVILSAAAGKAALRVFTRSNLEVVTTTATLAEVREYLPSMADSYGMELRILETQFRLLAIKGYPRHDYHDSVPAAARLMQKRDPDDIDLLALALSQRIPIWSNDRDFEGLGVDCYPTARLLKVLGL